MPKVTIYTQAYDPGREYLTQCIESVLGQTYGDFEWILIDNASTDDTPQIVDGYAAKDSRIVPVHMEKNTWIPNMFYRFLREKGTGKYVTYLDSDDWWDPDYLERLVPFAEENGLDLALTGAMYYFQGSDTTRVFRKLDEPVVLSLEEFAKEFPRVGPFAGALWSSLRPREKVLEMENDPREQQLFRQSLTWRLDTLMMLDYTDRCRRIGIDGYAPYHYRIHGKSSSHIYFSDYFNSNLYFHDCLQDFFRRHGALNERNLRYLKERHFTEMQTTVNTLERSDLPAEKKLHICLELTSHPLTIDAFTCECPERKQWWDTLTDILWDGVKAGPIPEGCTPQEIVRPLIPNCAELLTPEAFGLLDREPGLERALMADDRYKFSKKLLELTGDPRYRRGAYRPAELFCRAVSQDPLLRVMDDPRFVERHTHLASMVLDKRYGDALEEMTGVLLDGGERPWGEETYLQLYLTLAALEEQPSAFLFGKIRQAELYREQGRLEDCRAALDALDEMGAGALPEVAALKERCGGEGAV